MKNKLINIAVLITCHNRREKTMKCIDSLFKVLLPDRYKIEVFLTDDGSTDGTKEAVKSLYPQVNVIQGDGNLFWNRGMNLAWQIAGKTLDYDFYLWLNDDVILHKDSIHILLKDFQISGKSQTIIAGACESSKKEVSYSGYIGLTKKIKLSPIGVIQICDFFNGNVVLIPSTVFKRLGFLDPIFHHGKGDIDYGLRARKVGIKSFVSSFYVGICDNHFELPKWCNANYPLSVRLKSFYSPIGGVPRVNYIFERRHLGLLPAIFHYFTIYLRLLLPFLWKRR